MRLDRMSSAALERHLADGRRGVILPLGSLEPHGRPGALGTDAICAEAVAQRAAARAGGLVAPVLSYGMAQFHLGAPGCVSLRPSTLLAVLADSITSLGMGGLTRVLLLTGHGGNLAPAQAAIQEVMTEVSLGRLRCPAPLSVKLRAWWDGPRVAELRRQLYGEREGFHVTPSEIAMVSAVDPDLAVPPGAWPPYRAPAKDPLHELGGDRHEDAARHAARFPEGPIASDPSLATIPHGALLLAAAEHDLAEAFLEFERAADQPAR